MDIRPIRPSIASTVCPSTLDRGHILLEFEELARHSGRNRVESGDTIFVGDTGLARLTAPVGDYPVNS